MGAITLEELSRGMWESLVEVVKEDIPDEEGQVERFNPKQKDAIMYCLNAFSYEMFCRWKES